MSNAIFLGLRPSFSYGRTGAAKLSVEVTQFEVVWIRNFKSRKSHPQERVEDALRLHPYQVWRPRYYEKVVDHLLTQPKQR